MVQDLGFDSDHKVPTTRIYMTRVAQPWHNDAADLVGECRRMVDGVLRRPALPVLTVTSRHATTFHPLQIFRPYAPRPHPPSTPFLSPRTQPGLLCLRKAKAGGLSRWCSSITIYNEVLTRRPDLVPVMAGTWYLDRKDEVPPGKAPYFILPIANFHKVSHPGTALPGLAAWLMHGSAVKHHGVHRLGAYAPPQTPPAKRGHPTSPVAPQEPAGVLVMYASEGHWRF